VPSMYQIDLEIQQVFFIIIFTTFGRRIRFAGSRKKLESLFGGYIVPILKLCFLILLSFSSVPMVVVLFESTTFLHSLFFSSVPMMIYFQGEFFE
jgi:hypothetical protein